MSVKKVFLETSNPDNNPDNLSGQQSLGDCFKESRQQTRQFVGRAKFKE